MRRAFANLHLCVTIQQALRSQNVPPLIFSIIPAESRETFSCRGALSSLLRFIFPSWVQIRWGPSDSPLPPWNKVFCPLTCVRPKLVITNEQLLWAPSPKRFPDEQRSFFYCFVGGHGQWLCSGSSPLCYRKNGSSLSNVACDQGKFGQEVFHLFIYVEFCPALQSKKQTQNKPY